LIDLLRSIQPQTKTGLISNAWSGMRQYIRDHKFEDAFTAMVISAEVGVVKPDAKIYQIALEQLGVSPSEAVFVDDFIENVKGAQAVGMSAIHFKDSAATITQLRTFLKN
jgi:putative hydrolase of the HAD superfamily